jgi:tetratricopeptide (TPR) repeat protein
VNAELPEAQQQFEAARRRLGPDDPETVQAELNLAHCLVELNRPDEADVLLQHVVGIRTKDLGPDDPQTLLALGLSANVAKKLGRFEEARDLHIKVLAWMEVQENVQPADLAVMLMETAHLLAQWNEVDQAAEFYQRAFDMRRKALGSDDPKTLSSERWLALTRYRNGEAEAARELAEDAIERCRRSLGAEAPETLRVQELLTKISERG